MSSPSSSWADRRGLFQKGKEVHEPGRRLSGSGGSSGGIADAVRSASISSANSAEKSVSGSSAGDSAVPSSPTSQRRRVCLSDILIDAR